MITIETIASGKFFYNDMDLGIKYLYADGKIWLTKKDLSKIFRLDKSYIKAKLNILATENFINEFTMQDVYDREAKKSRTYYSLDLVILFGYSFKAYYETKFLIKTNKMIKKYIIPSKIKFLSLYIAGIFNISFCSIKNMFKPYFA